MASKSVGITVIGRIKGNSLFPDHENKLLAKLFSIYI